MASADGIVNSDSVDDLDLKTSEKEQDVKETRPIFGFDLKTPKTDLVLVFDEKKMYVTKVVLEMASPVFQKMFEETLDGSQGNEINIEGSDYYNFAEFLACIYPGIMLKVTIENVYRVQPLAFEYEVDFLKTTCLSVLADSLKDTNTETNLLKCMDIAYKHNIQGLKTECLKQAIQTYGDDTPRTDELLLMKNSYKDDIWKNIFPGLRSDASKFRFMTAAAKHASETRSYFESFNDAKYVATNWKFNWKKIWNSKTESILDIPLVWDGFRIWMNVKRGTIEYLDGYKTFTRDVMQFAPHAKHDHGNARCLAAVVIEFINIIPWNKNVFLGQLSSSSCDTITTKPTIFTSIGPDMFQSQSKGFILDDQIKVRVHLLVNRPTF